MLFEFDRFHRRNPKPKAIRARTISARSIPTWTIPALVFSLFSVGCGNSAQPRNRQELKTFHPRTTVVITLPGETLKDVSHRTGFGLAILEGLNPKIKDGKMPGGVRLRCPVGQPDIRRVEQSPLKGTSQ